MPFIVSAVTAIAGAISGVLAAGGIGAALVRLGGTLVIHDVFPDPADGGRPPYEIYCRALGSRAFEELGATGSLRVLRRVATGI